MPVKKNRVVFHIDMDAFFASVEQRDYPHYQNKPVIVGGKVGMRGVVSAASYEARRFGIHSAMPISEAYRRCPSGIFVQPRMDVYETVSNEIMHIFSRYSPLIEQISVDEAFVDMTGCDRLFGDPENAARMIADTIVKEQKLTASIGIAPNKFCAKVASEVKKPNGITLCPFEPAAVQKWLAPMPVDKIWGVGKQTAARLDGMGVITIGDLQQLSLDTLSKRFGVAGTNLYYLSRGIDDRPVKNDDSCKSLSREQTYMVDTADREIWQQTLFTLAQDVARRARKKGVKGSTVFITWRTPDFSRHTRQKSVSPPVNAARFIFEESLQLLAGVPATSLRLLGIGISGFSEPLQIDLFEDDSAHRQVEHSEKVADTIAAKFGTAIIKKGREVSITMRKTTRILHKSGQ